METFSLPASPFAKVRISLSGGRICFLVNGYKKKGLCKIGCPGLELGSNSRGFKCAGMFWFGKGLVDDLATERPG